MKKIKKDKKGKKCACKKPCTKCKCEGEVGEVGIVTTYCFFAGNSGNAIPNYRSSAYYTQSIPVIPVRPIPGHLGPFPGFNTARVRGRWIVS